jgi:ATP-dependent metalloprotease
VFASALANTCAVPLIYGSASRWQEAGALDEHLKAMRASFAEAKRKAPSILFIDEIDVFGNRSESDRNSAYMRAVITALLQLLDGFERVVRLRTNGVETAAEPQVLIPPRDSWS